MSLSTRSWRVGQQVERLLGGLQRMAPVGVGPQQQHREVEVRVEVEQLAARARRPALGEARPRAREVDVAADVGEGVAQQVARCGVGADRELDPALGPIGGARDVGQRAAEARHGAQARRRAPLLARRRAVQRVGHEHEPPRRDGPQLERAQQDLRAQVVAADERARPGGLHAEGGDDLGQPVQRVGVARAVLGVAVQRQVGEDQAVAIGQRLDDRLELAVAEQRRVQEHEAGAGARLAVGHARPVGVVVEAQLHPRRLPGALPARPARRRCGRRCRRAPRPSARCGAAARRGCPPCAVAPRRAAPTR